MAYYPSIPEIAKAYENDPRTRLAVQSIQTGTSSAPVAGGGWAWADGIARALQGVTGGYLQKKSQKKYEKEEQELMDLYASALGGTGEPAPTELPQQQPVPDTPVPGGGREAPTQALPTPGAPPAQQPMLGGPQMASVAPQGGQMAPDPLAPLPDAPSGPQAPANAPQIAAALGAPPPPPPGFNEQPAARPARTAPKPKAPDASAVARELGYGDHITSGYRGPNHALSKSNPRSYHARTHQAVDVAPIPGVQFEDYVDSYRQAGYSIVEAKNEVGAGRSKHATGDHWHVVLGPQTAAPASAEHAAARNIGGRMAEELPPMPDMPNMPQRPQDRAAVQSGRLAAGRKLMASANRFAFPTAMRMIEEGMGEQFTSDREALAAARGLDEREYGAGLDNYYGAQGDQRRAGFDERRDVRQNNFTREQTEDAQQYGTSEREASQQYGTSERQATQQFQAGENALDRANSMAMTEKTIAGRVQTAREKYGDFLSTPQGARLYEKVSGTISQNDGVIEALNQFDALNAETGTGGAILKDPTGIGSWGARTLSPNLETMQGITNTVAPLMRQAGSGAMSDRDVQMFKESVPNIQNSRAANQRASERMRKGFQRMNDFEMSRMEAAAQGRQAEFMREWSMFRQNVSIESGQSFDDWKGGIKKYDANGQAVQ